MIMKVTSRGITIPRRLLGEAKEVEVRQEEDRIVVVPVGDEPLPADDPIYELGSDPIKFGVTDASVNLDAHLAEDVVDDHAE
jgi:hypothetical protein